MDAHTGTEKTPFNSRVAAAICIFHNGSICLGRRADNDYPFSGYWAPFGGAVEEGENPMVAACRELKEETQVELDILDIHYMNQVSNEDGSIYILYAYHSPELVIPNLNFEHTESGYFKLEHIDSSPSPICPKVVSSIKSYESRRWKG
jgi:8-oxo-dGTP pyrophosphatase MutT (NUDIX family)